VATGRVLSVSERDLLLFVINKGKAKRWEKRKMSNDVALIRRHVHAYVYTRRAIWKARARACACAVVRDESINCPPAINRIVGRRLSCLFARLPNRVAMYLRIRELFARKERCDIVFAVRVRLRGMSVV